MLEVFKKTGWVLNNYSQFCFCKNLPKHGRHGQPFFGLVNRFCNYKRHHIFRKGLCGYHAEIIFSQNNLAFRASHAKKLFQKFLFHSKRFSPMRSSWLISLRAHVNVGLFRYASFLPQEMLTGWVSFDSYLTLSLKPDQL